MSFTGESLTNIDIKLSNNRLPGAINSVANFFMLFNINHFICAIFCSRETEYFLLRFK
jgi:hypothetical protein